MKNRFSKITLLVLSFALILGVAFALSAGAEENVKPEIIGKNIAYTDKTAIQIAVDAATVDASDVMLVVTKADGAEITVTKPESKTVNGKDALVFTLEGIPASAICDNVTIVVKSGDNASDAFTYSVAEYFYERLYSDGIINATEGKALSQKALYERYIAYGAAAQDLFLNYDDNGNRVAEPVILVDNYNVVAINKGVLANGNEVMISADSFSTTVTANDTLAADKTFDKKWTVTTYGETVTTQTVANGATVEVSGKMSVTPVYTDATGEYFLSDLKGTRWDFDTIKSVEKTDVFEAAKTGAGGTISIFDGSLYLDDGDAEDAAMYAKFYDGNNKNTATCTVFEFDFKANQFFGSTPIQIKIANIMYSISYSNAYDSSYGTGHKLCMTANGVIVPLGIVMNKWSTLRFEYYYAESKLKVFVNNEFVVDISVATAGSRGNSNFIYLTGNERKSASNADVYIDNVFSGNILNKPFVAGDPKAAN